MKLKNLYQNLYCLLLLFFRFYSHCFKMIISPKLVKLYDNYILKYGKNEEFIQYKTFEIAILLK